MQLQVHKRTSRQNTLQSTPRLRKKNCIYELMSVRAKTNNFSLVYFQILFHSLEPFTKLVICDDSFGDFPLSSTSSHLFLVCQFGSTPSTKF